MSINAVYEDSQGNVHESRMDGVDPTTKFSIADDFSTLVNYAVGDFCYHLGTLYKCTTAHTAGVWNAEHFTATQVGDELSELKNDLKNVETGGTRLSCVELGPDSPSAEHGGYIDFHFNGSSDDFTSRIIEHPSGNIQINGISIKELSDSLHYHKIAESASTGTYANKLNSLYSVYQRLSSNQKKAALLVSNDVDYFLPVNADGAFSTTYVADGWVLFITYSLKNKTHYRHSFNSGGAFDFTNRTSSEDGSILSLWLSE